ncbi:MAG: fasciclin domain-containing protein [Xanthobacteraceae bacterium]
MSKRFALFASAALVALAAAVTPAPVLAQMSEKTVTVGGAPMYPSKNIVQNAVNSKDHTTLVAAVKAAGLVDTLEGAGPFTVFAPTNAAFAKLPAGAVDTLLKPENKATLTKVLTYHVVPGRLTAVSLMKAVKEGEGEAHLKTVAGEDLTVKQAGPGKLTVTDAKGDVANVTIADVLQSNGVIHVVDTVLLPN